MYMGNEGKIIPVIDAIEVASRKIDNLRGPRTSAALNENRILLTTTIIALRGLCGACVHVTPRIRDIAHSNPSVDLDCDAGYNPIGLYQGRLPGERKPKCEGFEPHQQNTSSQGSI